MHTSSDNYVSRTDALPDDHIDYDFAGPPRYRCLLCGEEYPTETLARIHLARSQDPDHLHVNGFEGEAIPVEVVDREDHVFLPVLGPGDPGSVQQVGINHIPVDDPRLPERADERHRWIVATAARNWEHGYREITADVDSRFDELGFEPVSYATVRRIVRRYFVPQAEGQLTRDGGAEILGDLEALQQAIVISAVTDPERSDVKIANALDCARSYPCQVRERAGAVIARVRARLDEATNIEAALATELRPVDVKALRHHGYLDRLAVDEHKLMASVAAANGLWFDDPDQVDEDVKEVDEGDTEIWGRAEDVDTNERIEREPVLRLYQQVRFYRALLDHSDIAPDDQALVFARRVETALVEVLDG